MVVDPGARHPSEVEALHPGADRVRDLVGLGGAEDEEDVGGRLLEGLEEGVPRLRGQHVGLVDDVDLGAQPGGEIADPLAQLAHLVDAAVARRIDLEDVDRRPVQDLDAGLTSIAGLAVDRLQAVHGPGEDPGGRGLAGPPDAGKEIRVGERARHAARCSGCERCCPGR